jgi:uncharacterized C2H2 Zn-finger protein
MSTPAEGWEYERAGYYRCPRCSRWFRQREEYVDHAWGEKP